MRRNEEGGLRLHDDAAQFFNERLKTEWRNESWTRTYAERAVALCREAMDEPIRYHHALEDLCEDANYIDASTKTVHYLFWVDEDETSRLLTLRAIEGLAHNATLHQSVVEAAQPWSHFVSDRTKKRIGVLNRGGWYWRAEARMDLMRLLDDDAKRQWLPEESDNDPHAEERDAIRHWLAAGALRLSEQHDEAIERCRVNLRHLPENGSIRRKVSEEAQAVGYQFWKKRDYALFVKASEIAVRADPICPAAHCDLGVAHGYLGEHEKALQHELKALELDDSDARNWRGVGVTYGWLGDYTKAIEYVRHAVKLGPGSALNWITLARRYIDVRLHGEALQTLKNARAIEPDNKYLLAIELLLALYQNDSTEPGIDFCDLETTSQMYTSFWLAVALFYASRGAWSDVLSAFERMHDQNSTNASAWTGLWGARRLVDPSYEPDEEFIRETRQLVEKDPLPFPAALLAGLEGTVAETLDALERAIEHTPGAADEARFRPEFVHLRDMPRFQELTKPLEDDV